MPFVAHAGCIGTPDGKSGEQALVTPAAQIAPATSLPCPKTGCLGKMEVAQTWPAKLEKFRNVQLECPLCHLRDFQNFPVPERVFEAAIPFEFAAVVEHQIHGRGMVVKSGPNFTRVCFQGQKGKETEVFTLDLKLTQDAEELNAYRQTQERINRKTGQRTTFSSDIDPLTPPGVLPGHRSFIPGGNPDDLPGNRDMHCELCNKENFKLVFTERLWICEDCRDSVDIGEKVIRGSE